MLYWHTIFDHRTKEEVISLIENNILENIPKNLTAKSTSKHMPKCKSCPFGSMRQKPLPIKSSTTYLPGDCAVGDIKHMGVKDIDGYEYLALLVDVGSDKIFEYKLKKLENLGDIVVLLSSTYISAGHTMKLIRFDVQFLTKQITDYLLTASPKFEKVDQQHPAPYEHGQSGVAESIIQKIESSIQKVLKDSNSPKEFWGPIASNICKVRNSMNSSKHPSCSRNVKFGGKKVDLLDTPLIPFGSVVYAHIPTKNQTALGFKCIETVSFGSADGVKGGIILYNLKTKKRIIRRTFKVMGPGDSAIYKDDHINIEIE